MFYYALYYLLMLFKMDRNKKSLAETRLVKNYKMGRYYFLS
jgi:hypothetical protein